MKDKMFNFLLKGANVERLDELLEKDEDIKSVSSMINKCIREYYKTKKGE